MCQRWTRRFWEDVVTDPGKRRREITREKHAGGLCRVAPKPKQTFWVAFSFRIDGCENDRLFGPSSVINERCYTLHCVLLLVYVLLFKKNKQTNKMWLYPVMSLLTKKRTKQSRLIEYSTCLLIYSGIKVILVNLGKVGNKSPNLLF